MKVETFVAKLKRKKEEEIYNERTTRMSSELLPSH
jgi:hypothetical protein